MSTFGGDAHEGDGILKDQGAFVVPDILANAGGVMTRAIKDVLAVATGSGVRIRTAAYMLALERVAMAKQVRGVLP